MQQLFTGGLALTTALVWVVFFANLLNMYLFSYWMPTVLNLSGLTPAVAVFYASMFQLGGILPASCSDPRSIASARRRCWPAASRRA